MCRAQRHCQQPIFAYGCNGTNPPAALASTPPSSLAAFLDRAAIASLLDPLTFTYSVPFPSTIPLNCAVFMAQLVRLTRGKGDRVPAVVNLGHLKDTGVLYFNPSFYPPF